MADRVLRLERVRGATSPFVRAYGSFRAFEQETWDLIAARKLDERDMFDVLDALRLWEEDGTWGAWQQAHTRRCGR